MSKLEKAKKSLLVSIAIKIVVFLGFCLVLQVLWNYLHFKNVLWTDLSYVEAVAFKIMTEIVLLAAKK